MRAIRGDLGRLGRAAVLLEVADHAVVERQPNEPLYHLLLGALRYAGGADRPCGGRGSCSSCWRSKACSPTSRTASAAGRPRTWWRSIAAGGGVRCRRCRVGAGRVDRGARRDARHRRRPAPHGDRPTAVTELTRSVEHVALSAAEHHLERRVRAAGIHLDGPPA